MSGVKITQKGDFKKSESLLNRVLKLSPSSILHKFGKEGVAKLSSVTPRDTGLTSEKWSYSVEKTKSGYRLSWENDNVVDGIPVAILIQNGHGTKGGTYVEGIDYINPALRPIFEKIADELWKEVVKSE